MITTYDYEITAEAIVFANSGDSCVHLLLGDEISTAMHNRVKKLYLALRDQKIAGIREVVPAYRSVSVYYDPIQMSRRELVEWVKCCIRDGNGEQAGGKVRKIRIPTVFGGEYGPDLKRVADFHGFTQEQVVEKFCKAEFLNYFLGFMPGKPYLGGLPAELETPRMEVPRLKAPAGTVVLFGKSAGVFGVQQPTGANCIGRTPLKIYDPDSDSPTLLQMGDYLTFYQITPERFEALAEEIAAGRYQPEISYQEEPTCMK